MMTRNSEGQMAHLSQIGVELRIYNYPFVHCMEHIIMAQPTQHIKISRFVWHLFIGMLLMICSGSLRAQVYVPATMYSASPFGSMALPDYQEYQQSRQFNQKWFVSRYTAVSAGNIFYPGANAFYISAPIGLQLNRQLNKNLYAFGGVYAAPTFTSFNGAMMNSPYNKSYPWTIYPNNYFGINPGVYMGLMYKNEAGTFSISGSIRTESHSYPGYPGYPAASNRNMKK